MLTLEYGILIMYFVGLLAVGVISSRRQKDISDYYIGGREKGTFSIAALWVSGWVGGASILGTATRAYTMGITAVWYVGIIAIACLLFGFTFSKIVNRVGERFQHLTYSDFLRERYDGRCAIIATISNIIANTAYLAAQLVAAASIINLLMGIDLNISFVIATAVVVLYTTLGGFNAVTYTDWIQFLLIIAGFVVVGVPLGAVKAGGFDAVFTALPASHFDIGAWGWSALLGLATSMILSFYTSMDSFTKCFAAKDAKTARNGIIWAAVALILIAVACTFLGLVAYALLPDLGNPDNALPQLVLMIFPTGVRALLLTAVLAAVMSTADISVLSASACITNDLYVGHFRKGEEMGEKKLLRTSVLVSALVGICGALIAWKLMDIMDILYIAFTINSAALFFPTICAFYYKKANTRAAFVSMAASLSTVIIWYIAGWIGLGGIFTAIDPVWPGLFVSAVIFFPMCIRHTPSEEDQRKTDAFTP